MTNKVVLIGCGNVGTSYLYSLINQNCFLDELVIIDINKDKVLGEVLDLNHCLAYLSSKIKIRVGDYQDVLDAKIVCICAGVNQKIGETRLDLVAKNKEIIKNIIENVMKYHFNGIFLVATNPVDIIADTIFRISKLNQRQIIGTGTSLDTARLRFLLSEKLEINPKNIHAYVIGEHGDSEFFPFSNATIGLNPLTDYLNNEELKSISLTVKNSAYEIIRKKGFTNFGIGVCLTKITNAILQDENSILTVSCYNQKHDIYISQVAIINKDGIKKVIDLKLNEEEKKLFENSIKVLKNE